MKYFNKQLASILFIVLVIITHLHKSHAMETEKKITLKIFPENVRYLHDGKEILGQKLAVLQISGVDNFALFDEAYNDSELYKTWNYDFSGTAYSPAAFYQGLKNGYPLEWHRKFHFPFKIHFTILLFNSDVTNSVELILPEGIKERLLKYICSDLGNQPKDNYNFLHSITLDPIDNTHWSILKDINNENEINAGDGIAIVSPKETMVSVQYDYCGVALGQGLFISKHKSGRLMVNNLDFLKNIQRHDSKFLKIRACNRPGVPLTDLLSELS